MNFKHQQHESDYNMKTHGLQIEILGALKREFLMNDPFI